MPHLETVLCTIHNLEFGYDRDRVKALGHEPALVNCPACALKRIAKLEDEIEQVKGHRDLLLQAIDLKATLMPGATQHEK